MKILRIIIVKLKRKIYIFYIKNFRKFIRISSKPYISGDTFRKYSNHVLDEISNLNVSRVQSGDIIFVKPDFLKNFFEEFVPQINNNFKLITHNSDIEINKDIFLQYRNNNFIWFAQNVTFLEATYNNIYQIPIGLENRSYLKNGLLSHFKKKNISLNQKLDKIYCSFNFSTNENRINIFNTVKDHELIIFSRFKDHKNFIKDLSNYKFNICPVGNGVDTHRFWESLMVGSIPIVEDSLFIQNFKNHKIPMLVLQDWNKINSYGVKELNLFYEQNKEKLEQNQYLLAEYWLNFISSKEIN